MNRVRSNHGGQPLGQFPDEPLIMDVQYGPSDETGIVLSPYQSYGSPYGSEPDYAPAPSTSVPKPSSSPIYSPYQTWGSIENAPNTVSTAGSTLPPGPSPRVNVPLSLSNPSSISLWLSNNWLTVAGVGVALVVLSSMGGGGRRR